MTCSATAEQWISWDKVNSTVIGGMLFSAALIMAAVTDIRTRAIPKSAYVLIVLAGLISFSPARLWGVAIALPFYFAAGFSGKIGSGDVKLTAVSGFVLGFHPGVAGLVMALSFAALYAVVDWALSRIRHRDMPECYPIAPFLGAGFAAVYMITF